MYMRIAWVQTEPGQGSKYEAEFRRVYSAEAMRAVWLSNAHDNPDSYFIVTLWDSLQAIQDWESSSAYLTGIAAPLNAFILGNYSVSVCEVKYARNPVGTP